MSKVADIYDAAARLAPFELACSFDNAGLLAGDPGAEVTGCVVALDLTPAVLAEAVRENANLIVTHHPVIFDPLRRLLAGQPAYELARRGISVISAHTNLDIAQGGVNDCLAARLGLLEIRPFGEDSMGREGVLPEPMTAGELAAYVKESLNCSGLRYTDGGKAVRRVAVCGGSGGSLLPDALSRADALITGDVKHNVFMDALWGGFCLIDAGHYKTEALVLHALCGHIGAACPDTPVWVSRDMKEEVLYL